MTITYNKIIGTEGYDALRGGEGADWLDGRGGNDSLDGREGDDKLYGGEGNDVLYGREGDDKLYGNAGADELYGGEDNDMLDGGKGNDFLSGDGHGNELFARRYNKANGNDRLYGREGNDNIWGGYGNDYLDGGEGADSLYGYYGNDVLYGREGNDQLTGGDGDDKLYGGKGNDVVDDGDAEGDDYLDGGEGSDWLIGRRGADTLRGGSGTDFFIFHRGDSLGSGDVITDFTVAGANRDALDLRHFNIDLRRDLESQGLTLSGLMDADGDSATDDRKITLPDGGTITLLNLGTAALTIDDFAFAVTNADGSALIIFDAGAEEEQPEESPLQQHLDLANTPIFPDDGGAAWRQESLNAGTLGHVDAGDLDSLTLPESDSGAYPYRARYLLYYDDAGGTFQLRLGDEVTGDLRSGATAAQIDAALEALDGVTEADVAIDERGDWTLTITADVEHPLAAIDGAFDGNLQLDYIGA